MLLTLRIIANFFLHSSLHELLVERREDIVGHLNKLVEDSATPNESDLNVQDNKGKYSLKWEKNYFFKADTMTYFD